MKFKVWLSVLFTVGPAAAAAEDTYPHFAAHLTGDILGHFGADPDPSLYAMGLQGNGGGFGLGIRLSERFVVYGDLAFRALRRIDHAPAVLQLGTAVRWFPLERVHVTVVPQAALLEVTDGDEETVSEWGYGAELRIGSAMATSSDWTAGLGVGVSALMFGDDVITIAALTLGGNYR